MITVTVTRDGGLVTVTRPLAEGPLHLTEATRFVEATLLEAKVARLTGVTERVADRAAERLPNGWLLWVAQDVSDSRSG